MNPFNLSLPESSMSTELMRILQLFAYGLSGNAVHNPAAAQLISMDIVSG